MWAGADSGRETPARKISLPLICLLNCSAHNMFSAGYPFDAASECWKMTHVVSVVSVLHPAQVKVWRSRPLHNVTVHSVPNTLLTFSRCVQENPDYVLDSD